MPYWLPDLERDVPPKADLNSGRSDATEAQMMAALTSIWDQRRTCKIGLGWEGRGGGQGSAYFDRVVGRVAGGEVDPEGVDADTGGDDGEAADEEDGDHGNWVVLVSELEGLDEMRVGGLALFAPVDVEV